jgi:hypothetical protein
MLRSTVLDDRNARVLLIHLGPLQRLAAALLPGMNPIPRDRYWRMATAIRATQLFHGFRLPPRMYLMIFTPTIISFFPIVIGFATHGFLSPWFWVFLLGWMALAIPMSAILMSHLVPPDLRRISAQIVVAKGCCASCGYVIESLPPDPDGCTTCPECGAAWKLPPVQDI